MKVTNRSVLFLLLYLGAIFTLAYLFKPYFTFLILGGIIVVLLDPVNRWVRSYIPNRMASSLLMTLLAIVLILIPLGSLVYSIGSQIDTVKGIAQSTNFSEISQGIEDVAGFSVNVEAVVVDGLNRLRGVATHQAPTILGSVTSIILNVFIMFFLIYYGFKEGDRLKRGLLSLLPLDDVYKERLKERAHSVLYGTLYGQLVVSMLQGLLVGGSFWLFGLSGGLLWGFVAAILAFLPLLGTPLVWVPGTVALWTQNQPTAAIVFFVFNAVFTTNIDNVIKPKLIGDRVQMHPLLVLLSILGGLHVFGFIGFIVGPVIAAVCILIISFYVQDFSQASEQAMSDEATR